MSIFGVRLPWGGSSPTPSPSLSPSLSPSTLPTVSPVVAPTSSASTALVVVTDVFKNATNFSPREVFTPITVVTADFFNTTAIKVAEAVEKVVETFNTSKVNVAEEVDTAVSGVAEVVANVTETLNTTASHISAVNVTETVNATFSGVAEVVSNATEALNTTASDITGVNVTDAVNATISNVVQVVVNATEVVQARGSVFMLPVSDITSGVAMAVGMPTSAAKIIGVGAQALVYVGCAAGATVLGQKALKEWRVRDNGPAAKYAAAVTAILAVAAHQVIATATK